MYHVVSVRRYNRDILIMLINKLGVKILSMQRVDCYSGICYEFLIHVETRVFNKLRKKCIDHGVTISVDELGL